ncbi:hypothetical protein GGF40_002483 [Coemansia sp. RSA 1286]|nr:hypothetical protein GGF40_002483 [Coemansia sp. RSA 1286]
MNHQQIAARNIELYYSQAINDIIVLFNDMGKQEMDTLAFEYSKDVGDAALALGVRAVVVVAESDDSRYDSLARVFGVQGTIGEDQVTGSAHTAIASLFMQRFGKSILRARQCSKRGGDLLVEIDQNNNKAVVITGSAVTIVGGTMSLESVHKNIAIFTVDAFADAPFKGNQAAIVLVPEDKQLSATTMLTLAGEMNISETAYLTPSTKGLSFTNDSRFSLRWFTPACEVDLCGHATLAAAHILFYELNNGSDTLVFDTLSGDLCVTKQKDGSLQMQFPEDAPVAMEITQDVKTVVAGVLDAEYNNEIEVLVSPKLKYMVVRDPQVTYKQLSKIQPKITTDAYGAGQRLGISGVIVTCEGNDRDFLSRYFGPWCGIDEDPVTGSAHTVLAPFWKPRLNKNKFTAYQCSPRGGELVVELLDQQIVAVSGKAVVLIRGTLNL